MQGSRTSSADTEASLHSASDNSEEHRRHVQRFIRAAPILAAAAMAMQADDDDDDESLNIQPERRSYSSAAQQRPSDKPGKPSKSPVARQLRPEAPSAAQSIPAVPVTGSAESLHTQELVRTARAAATPRASRNWLEDFEMGPGEPCLPFHRRPTSGAEQVIHIHIRVRMYTRNLHHPAVACCIQQTFTYMILPLRYLAVCRHPMLRQGSYLQG